MLSTLSIGGITFFLLACAISLALLLSLKLSLLPPKSVEFMPSIPIQIPAILST